MLTATSLEDLNRQFCDRCVPLLFAAENQSPQAMGSAVLLEKDSEHYLVSAAHNYKLIQEFGSPYLVVRRSSDPEYSAIARFDNFSCVISDDHGREQVDLLFSHFLKEESAHFPTFAAFVSEEDFGEERDADFFYVVGFAASRNKRPKHVLKGQTIKTYSSTSLHCDRHPNEGKILDALGYNPNNHIVVSFNRRSCSRNGIKIFAPDPHGISGGALFGIKKTKTGYRGFLCGIAMEYLDTKGAIVCTKLSVLLDGLYPHRFDPPDEIPNQLESNTANCTLPLNPFNSGSPSEKAAIVLLPRGIGICLERFDFTLGDLIKLSREVLNDSNITADNFGHEKHFFFVNSSTGSLITDNLDLARSLPNIGIHEKDVIELRLTSPAPEANGQTLNPMRGVKFFIA